MALVLKYIGYRKGEKQLNNNRGKLLRKINDDDFEIEIVKVGLIRDEYESKIVRLVTAMLEIDEAIKQLDDHLDLNIPEAA